MTAGGLSQIDVFDILDEPKKYRWEVQGFGMLRTYLTEDRALRLQVWDSRLLAFGNNAVHDHPWDFKSTVFSGLLYNQRYLCLHPTTRARGDRYIEKLIVPGIGGGETAKVREVVLEPMPIEVYGPGETYKQVWHELHVTRFIDSTITVIERSEQRAENVARSMAKEDNAPWTFYEPRPATETEVYETIGRALNRFTL